MGFLHHNKIFQWVDRTNGRRCRGRNKRRLRRRVPCGDGRPGQGKQNEWIDVEQNRDWRDWRYWRKRLHALTGRVIGNDLIEAAGKGILRVLKLAPVSLWIPA